MKTSLTKSKSSLILFLGVVSLPLLAKQVAQVTEVTGQVFMVSPEGKTKTLKPNDHMEERSEVMVEEGASLTLNDYYDATYHLIGGTHAKFFDKSVQLKRGKAWVQSKSIKHPLVLTTANGNVGFNKGEFITTFDLSSSRTQVLVVDGEVEVSNVLNKNMKYSVAAGTFSLIDPDVEDGSPRTPVKVGLNSLNAALSEFKKLPDDLIAVTPSRSIASVEENTVKKGEIIYMMSGRNPASVEGEAYNYLKKKIARVVPVKKAVVTHAKIKYYGTSWKPLVQVVTPVPAVIIAPREPASVSSIKLNESIATKLTTDDEFGASLKKHSYEQPKYSKDLDRLIEDLKSY